MQCCSFTLACVLPISLQFVIPWSFQTMPRTSDRVQMIRDLTTACVWAHLDSLDNVVSYNHQVQYMPTDGQMLFPNDPQTAYVYNALFSEGEEYSNLLVLVSKTRYLVPRFRAPHASPFNMSDMLRECQTDFRQAMQTSREGFKALANLIWGHPIFFSSGHTPQPQLDHQLAITLERLGSNGNGASVGWFSCNYKVSRGAVINCTRRVITAILDQGGHCLQWPGSSRRKGISSVLAQEGFPSCVGFVDGTTIPLYQRPGIDGEVFFDRKHRYSINAQIVCGCDQRITYVYAWWPGSCCDSTVYAKTELALNPKRFFSPGKSWLI